MFRLRITSDLGFEFWQDIPGYEGYYMSSTYGRIKSLERVVLNSNLKYGLYSVKEHILTPIMHKDGYFFVGLHKNGKKKIISIHRLVGLTFLFNPNKLPCINHKSEVKTENQVWNLEWCTVEYNNNYGAAISKRVEKQSKPVIQYDLNGNFISEYPSTNSVSNFGFQQAKVSDCCRGERKTHKGYVWKFKS